MKYFTPELYEAYASGNAELANELEANWDAAEARYERRLAKLRPSLPQDVLLLADKLALHDANLINLVCSPTDCDVWACKDGLLFLLSYRLRAPVEMSARRHSKVFREAEPRWLYDEIDMPRKGTYSHEVLFSDGRTLRLIFDHCSVHEVHPLGTAARMTARIKQSNGRKGESLDDLRRSLADVSPGRTRPIRHAIASLSKRK